MALAKEGNGRTGPNRTARRLTHGLLILTVLVQPGCMCGCSGPGAPTSARNGNMVSAVARSEISPATAETCCPHCSAATEDRPPVSTAP